MIFCLFFFFLISLGSQGGLWKRGDHGRRFEVYRETDGFATVRYNYARATFLSRLRPIRSVIRSVFVYHDRRPIYAPADSFPARTDWIQMTGIQGNLFEIAATAKNSEDPFR